MAYYISFVKTLSLKLNSNTIHFFYNEVIHIRGKLETVWTRNNIIHTCGMRIISADIITKVRLEPAPNTHSLILS